jgi:glycosyltransferase involved in cell wall biosynthesis
MAPRLTIAIPTINRADLLCRAIESALAQTSQEIEILVSDNGSTDNTPAVIARYSDPRLRTFRHNSTMSAAKHGQFLIAQAQGEFFLGLSDDDYLEQEFAAEVLAMFDRHPELSFVYTGCAIHYEDHQVPAVVGPPVESGPTFLAQHYGDRREVIWCACVTRARDLRKIGPPSDDRIIGDMYYWTKLAFLGPVGCVPKVLSHYILFRQRNDNVSHGTSPLLWARESQLLSDEVMRASRQAGASAEYLSNLEACSKHHIARSTANQFVWTRIRGASVLDAWKGTFTCRPYLAWNLPAVIRLGAALFLPRKVLRIALLNAAAKLAVSRSASPTHGESCAVSGGS